MWEVLNSNSSGDSWRTAESVSPQHPDKITDQIADAILDACLRRDPEARAAIEVVGGHGEMVVMGEVSAALLEGEELREEIEKIGARLVEEKMTWRLNLAPQSPGIASGVDIGGAGDQGIMIGYATAETPEMLPREVVLARRLNQFCYEKWPTNGKTQVTLQNNEVTGVVASFQRAPGAELRARVEEWLASETEVVRAAECQFYVNPCGDWDGGPFAVDAGLTGRKIVIDNYGPRIPVGGGAFSGKDPTKVDRSGAYMARRVAVDYLRARKAREVLVRLAYVIGIAAPVEATVIIDGQAEEIQGYDLTPEGIIEFLDLRRPIYEPTARWGHFGHPDFSWEG